MTDPDCSSTVVFDRLQKLVAVRLIGFWDEAKFDAFEATLAARLGEITKANLAVEELGLLVDARDFPIQQKEIVVRFQDTLARVGGWRRVATVVSGGALEQMQAKRATSVDRTKFFASEAEARAWLL